MQVKISGATAQSIFESIREQVSSGALQAGYTLPPVRELAERLGVNRNTVSAAYQRLTQAGLAVTQGRLGTRITTPTHAGEQEGMTDTSLIDLADGSPCIEWLPDLDEVAGQTHFHQYLYGQATVLPAMLDYGRDWFAGSCPAEFAITLCNGAIDSMERLMAAHLVPGDSVVVEDPCYISSANAMRLAGMKVVGAAIDRFGMQPDALRAALSKGARAVLITPRAHNPTGACLSAQRAAEIRKVLTDYPNVLVMVDDHFALMASCEYHSVIPDSSLNWAVLRSVSKGFGPDLRMAFVAADKDSVQRINTRLAPGMSWVSRVLQSLVHTCLTSDTVQVHLAEVRGLCAKRRNMLIEALAGQGIHCPMTSDGLNVWVPVNGPSQAAAYELSRRGWLVRPGSAFDINQQSQAIRVSLQNLDEDKAGRFAKDLAVISA
ncbi:aminotransferase class I/II-fold pyridoxal phosphate-dependent enzyme [Bowmanella dokdonensis]|uniref:Aminotransferase class I/II-fold pyridoxal phosphate-dependent enzyme n=1 Tax=Bowmanella dokdonensis TaxID=751969 RepID=A0A939IPC8_9ALTE|nr:aminotransferase class I/II-fold pyridoxal phosphate-dependent enzyme [Bowmanella dokdonensis]MBN7825765.1 aminotransferase class I/II-fold pyridoxal phosphate-dependent enzyme [Bowmanella dokdonensis]